MGEGLGVRVEPRRHVAGRLGGMGGTDAHPQQLRRREVGLLGERCGSAPMLGEEGGNTLPVRSEAALDDAGELEVLPRADGTRERLVGHVPDQGMLEGELALSGDPARRRGGEQILIDQGGERPVDRHSSGELSDDPVPEALADDRGGLQEAALVGPECIEACRKHRVDAVGELPGGAVLLSRSRLTISSANSGLPPDRSATCCASSAPPS